MSPNDPLNELLDRWRPPPQARDLRSEIRQAIATERVPRRERWLARLDIAFARPSFAVTFVIACVLLGLFLAEARVSRQQAMFGAQIARSYLQLIDPLIETKAAVPSQKEAQ